MKTLGFAIALSLTGAAAQAGTLFEIPINGGVARFQLDEDCGQSVCASISWTENDRHRNRQNGKEISKKEPSNRSAKADSKPAAKPAPSEVAPALGSSTSEQSVSSAETTTSTAVPATGGAAGSGSSADPLATAEGATVAPAEPASQPTSVAHVAPAPSATPPRKASPQSPVGEWLVEGGEARIRIEECAKNLCGVVSAANNANETDRKNPKPELRNRPIIGLPVLLDMEPAGRNRWEGRIYNAKNGQTYDANISLVDSQSLRVEGCVFGGFICGGQNWTRVN
jgi:uncharacterized protein (DUF2147 family)